MLSLTFEDFLTFFNQKSFFLIQKNVSVIRSWYNVVRYEKSFQMGFETEGPVSVHTVHCTHILTHLTLRK